MIHATPVRNVRSILKGGLLASKSKGKIKSVWVCTPGNWLWAYSHAIKQHGVQLRQVAIVEVDTPRSWLKRGGRFRKGLWHTGGRDVPPERIKSVNFSEALKL